MKNINVASKLGDEILMQMITLEIQKAHLNGFAVGLLTGIFITIFTGAVLYWGLK